jgi:PTH1 family peptidyl-tRNA hydrolase|tara:strand:+ start:458 stop:1018 length:561 start_codon:yes stop_codon:yes gene_type:complete
MNKYLIVGLGNPGEEYKGTRHNIGFDIVDYFASKFEAKFKVERFGLISSFSLKGRKLYLLKPSTFMNLSGKAIQYHLRINKVNINNLFVVSDDLHLPFGTIKCKKKGSDGGHNGHKNIIECLQDSTYSRLKFGIGNDFKKGHQSNYVLSPWSNEESLTLRELVKKSSDLILDFCLLGIEETMQNNN